MAGCDGGSSAQSRTPQVHPTGRRCGRRVGKLYLPPGEAYFACRECHQLTYQSQQEHRCGLGMLGPVAEHTGREVGDVRRIMKPQILLQRA